MRTSLSTAGRPAYLTIKQAADVLGVPASTVHRWVRIGAIRTARRRSRLVIPASEVARLLGGAQ